MKRNILVSGGNRGIGLAIVNALAGSDDNIICGCRTEKPREDKVLVRKMDLSSPDKINESCKNLQNEFGHLDVIINNAGILIEGDIVSLESADFDLVYQVNVRGPYQLIKTFLPAMIKNNYGRIVNVSSGWGSFDDGLTGPFSYSFSKAALNALTLTASRNLPSNVKINSICPGWVRTDMGGDAAPRTPAEGADTAVWLINQDESSPSGKFFRDRQIIDW